MRGRKVRYRQEGAVQAGIAGQAGIVVQAGRFGTGRAVLQLSRSDTRFDAVPRPSGRCRRRSRMVPRCRFRSWCRRSRCRLAEHGWPLVAAPVALTALGVAGRGPEAGDEEEAAARRQHGGRVRAAGSAAASPAFPRRPRAAARRDAAQIAAPPGPAPHGARPAMELAKPAFPALPQAKEDSEDWTYPMRREMQEILPGLFLGPYSSAMKSKLPILQKHGITHVICIRQNIEANFIKPNFQQLFRYLVLDIADNPVENIIRFFPMTKEFIDGSLQSGGKVLVHGNAGISRSAALVIAYIMETFGVKYRDAFTYVQERRFCINPNAGFVHQLQEYEAIYLAKLTIQMMSPLQLERSLSVPPGTTGSLKRMHEEDEELGTMQVAAAQNG